MKTQEQSRRNFLKAAGQLTVLGGVISLGSCIGGCSSDTTSPTGSTGVKVNLILANEPDLANTGGYIRRVFSGNNNNLPVIVVHTADKKFQTMTSLCGHDGGSIQAPSGGNKSICNKHFGEYSIAEGNFAQNVGGQVGPTLKTFLTEYDEVAGTITITF
ncbi:MAG: twin-arginine translocation signal domain-containing protein [Ignavibacteriae bacterium]|nr:twin-arginine translocation signal domain-containing protein [Ignavibacteriota bacterium]